MIINSHAPCDLGELTITQQSRSRRRLAAWQPLLGHVWSETDHSATLDMRISTDTCNMNWRGRLFRSKSLC